MYAHSASRERKAIFLDMFHCFFTKWDQWNCTHCKILYGAWVKYVTYYHSESSLSMMAAKNIASVWWRGDQFLGWYLSAPLS